MKKILFLFILAAGFCFLEQASGEKMDKIIAIVNDDIITEDELDLMVKMMAPREASMLKEEDLREFKKVLLNRMIEDRLILQEAKNEKIDVDDKMLEDRISQIKEKAGSQEAFLGALKAEGLSIGELREKLKKQLSTFLVIQKNVTSKVNVSPKEVTDFFHQNKDEFVKPESVLVDSIFVSDPKTLEDVKLQLSKGENFKDVSDKYSEKSNIEEVIRGQLKKDLEDFIFGLEIGKYSQPFKTQDGYYIFLVKKHSAPEKLSLEEVREKITAYLENRKTEELLKEWIEDLKDKAYISIRQ